MKIDILKPEIKSRPARHMGIGDMGVAVDGDIAGHVLLRYANGIVNLTDPTLPFTYDYEEVTVLPSGTILTLTYVPATLDTKLRDILREKGKGSEKINAIKHLREATGLGLKESKYYVDELYRKLELSGAIVPEPTVAEKDTYGDGGNF